MIWFGRLSAISQLASWVGGRGRVGKNPLHIITLPGREAVKGVVFPPLDFSTTKVRNHCTLFAYPLCSQ